MNRDIEILEGEEWATDTSRDWGMGLYVQKKVGKTVNNNNNSSTDGGKSQLHEVERQEGSTGRPRLPHLNPLGAIFSLGPGSHGPPSL